MSIKVTCKVYYFNIVSMVTDRIGVTHCDASKVFIIDRMFNFERHEHYVISVNRPLRCNYIEAKAKILFDLCRYPM